MKLKEIISERMQDDVNIHHRDVRDGRFISSYIDMEVKGDFNCADTKITTLEGGPKKVMKDYYANRCQLTSLEGAPNFIGSEFMANSNFITSLEGIGKKYLREINGYLSMYNNPLKSNVLGLMLIKNIKSFQINYAPYRMDENIAAKLQEIMNGHLRGDIMECREELVQAGLKEFAKL